MQTSSQGNSNLCHRINVHSVIIVLFYIVHTDRYMHMMSIDLIDEVILRGVNMYNVGENAF